MSGPFVLGLYHVLGFLMPSQLSRCCMYMRMKALTTTCLKKKNQWINKKRSFYSNTTVTLLTRHCTSSQLRQDNYDWTAFTPVIGRMANTWQHSQMFLSSTVFFFLFFSNLYRASIRIRSEWNWKEQYSRCYRVYIVLTLKPDWLLFNILLSNIKILSFFLKDGIQ